MIYSTSGKGVDNDYRTPFRDLALIELMRKCNFVVDADTLMVYGHNTEQHWVESCVSLTDWRKKFCMKNSDDCGKILRLYKKPVESYILDSWKSAFLSLCGYCIPDVLITTKSVASVLNGLPSFEYMSVDRMMSSIANIASAIELDAKEAYNYYDRMHKQTVTVSGSKIWNVINIWYYINEQHKLLECNDADTLRNFKDLLCDYAKVITYLKDGDTLRTMLRLSWDTRLTSEERIKTPCYKNVLHRLMGCARYSADAIICMDLEVMYSKRESDDTIGVINDSPEHVYLLEELKRIQEIKRVIEMRRKCGKDEPVICDEVCESEGC